MAFQQNKSNFSADRDLSYQALGRVLDSTVGRSTHQSSDDCCFEQWTLVSIQKATQIARRGSEGNYRIEWTEALELANTVEVKLPGFNKPVSVISARAINKVFPSRFKMAFHPSWQKLRDSLYSPDSVDYSHKQLFLIQQYNAILHEAIGVNFEMPNGCGAGLWEGDDTQCGDHDHYEFWVEDNADYELWVNWSNEFDKMVKKELMLLLQDEVAGRGFQQKPPTMQLALGRLGRMISKRVGS